MVTAIAVPVIVFKITPRNRIKHFKIKADGSVKDGHDSATIQHEKYGSGWRIVKQRNTVELDTI